MIKRKIAILCSLILAISYPDEIIARERSVGGTFSYAGSGIEYAQEVDSKNFTTFQIRMETSSMFRSSTGRPGISASAFWNIVFYELVSDNGNNVRFYTGPGIAAGAANDGKSPFGLFVGLKGRIGGECSFPRKITISLSISPMIGGHFTNRNGMVSMLPYRTGLTQGVQPEVGIRYVF